MGGRACRGSLLPTQWPRTVREMGRASQGRRDSPTAAAVAHGGPPTGDTSPVTRVALRTDAARGTNHRRRITAQMFTPVDRVAQGNRRDGGGLRHPRSASSSGPPRSPRCCPGATAWPSGPASRCWRWVSTGRPEHRLVLRACQPSDASALCPPSLRSRHDLTKPRSIRKGETESSTHLDNCGRISGGRVSASASRRLQPGRW